MADHNSQVELSIDLGNEEDEPAFKHLLSSLPLEAVVLQTLSQAGIKQPVLVALLITTDETVQSLNKQYRSQDRPTDLLYGEEIQTKQAFVTPPDTTMHLGDIVISWPTVKRQASEVGHNPVYELLFLLSHGVLHLVGDDDQT